MRRGVFALASVISLACAKTSDPPPKDRSEHVAEVASVDAPPLEIEDAGSLELAPVKLATDGGTLPPTGDYDIVVTTVSDDCTPRDPLPARTQGLVVGRAWRGGRIGANVPMPRATGGMHRSDVSFEPRRALHATLHPDLACPAYAVDRTIEVASATHDVIRLLVTDRKSDPSVCGRPGTACTSKVHYTYGLMKEHCAAGCNPKLGAVDAGLRYGGLGVAGCVCAD